MFAKGCEGRLRLLPFCVDWRALSEPARFFTAPQCVDLGLSAA